MRGRRIYAAILAAMGLLLLTGVKSGGSYDLPDGLEMKKSGFELMSLPEGPSAALPLQALNGLPRRERAPVRRRTPQEETPPRRIPAAVFPRLRRRRRRRNTWEAPGLCCWPTRAPVRCSPA